MKPTAQSTTTYLRAIDLDTTITVDKIIVILSLSQYDKGTVETSSEVHVINHDDFHQWLDDNDQLIETYGPIDDPKEEEISYTEYIMSNVCKADYREYLREKNLTSVTHFDF